MSLESWYGGDDETELDLWSELIDPSFLPSANDDQIAEREQERLESEDYQDVQEGMDEEATVAEEPTDLASLLAKLLPEDFETIIRLVQEKLDEQE